MKAVEVIMEHGVPEDRIIFINLVSAPFPEPWDIGISNSGEGLVASRFENIRNALSIPKSRKSLAGHLICVWFFTSDAPRLLGGSMRVSTTERTSCRGSETLANGGASTFSRLQTRTDILNVPSGIARDTIRVSSGVHIPTWLSKRTMTTNLAFLSITSHGGGAWRNAPLNEGSSWSVGAAV